jgi:hypothetical protein
MRSNKVICFQIKNQKSEIKNVHRMADPPRLTKLGAKWVEVRNGGQKASERHDESVFENVASNTRWSIARRGLRYVLDLSKVLPLSKGGSRGRSTILTLQILDCRFLI